MINARMETIAEKNSFKAALKRRRCLVPANGFYEWKKEGKEKQPHHIRLKDDRLYAFASLWGEWQSPEGPLRSYTISTGPPHVVADIHDHMAMILEPGAEAGWLAPSLSVEDALELLKVYPGVELEAVPVDKRVGNVKFDEPEAIEPI